MIFTFLSQYRLVRLFSLLLFGNFDIIRRIEIPRRQSIDRTNFHVFKLDLIVIVDFT